VGNRTQWYSGWGYPLQPWRSAAGQAQARGFHCYPPALVPMQPYRARAIPDQYVKKYTLTDMYLFQQKQYLTATSIKYQQSPICSLFIAHFLALSVAGCD
jgi:hypothetical protein